MSGEFFFINKPEVDARHLVTLRTPYNSVLSRIRQNLKLFAFIGATKADENCPCIMSVAKFRAIIKKAIVAR